MDNAIGSVCAQFKSRGIVLPPSNEWLIACVECYFEMKPNHSPSELFEFAYEQWTLADLIDVNAPSLPPACKSCNKIILPGKYAVQVNYVVNVAVPFHKQLQEIRRPDAQKNLEIDNERQDRDRGPKTGTSRLLKLEITDGVTTVTGFEYTPIPAITRCVPGEKILLIGPIEARKGALFLKPENITVLGGEVDTLLICNAMENVLARSLKEPENPDPYKTSPVNGQMPSSAAASRTQMPPPPAQPTGYPIIPNSPTAPVSQTSRRNELPNQRPPETPAPRSTLSDMTRMLDDGEDEIFASLSDALDDSIISEESASANTAQPSTGHQSRTVSSPSINRPKTAQPTTSKNPMTKNKSGHSSKLTQPTLSGFLSQKKPQETSIVSFSDLESTGPSSSSNLTNRQLESSSTCAGNSAGKFEAQRGLNGSSGNVVNVQQKKRKDPDALETYLPTATPPEPSSRRPNEEPTSSIMGGSKCPPANDDLQYDWIPPPKKANLEQLRPSHEKGKILIDYTNSASLDLNLLSSQSENVKHDHKFVPPAVKAAIDVEPFPPKDYPSHRTARGKVVQMNKLKISNGKWQLTATISVKGVQIQVDFSPETVDKLLTVSCEEIERHKPEFGKNPELKQKYNNLIKMGQEKVRNLDCEMEFYFKNFISKPILTNVFLSDR